MIFVLKKIVMEALKYPFWVLQSQPGEETCICPPNLLGEEIATLLPFPLGLHPQPEVSLRTGQGCVPLHTVHTVRNRLSGWQLHRGALGLESPPLHPRQDFCPESDPTCEMGMTWPQGCALG